MSERDDPLSYLAARAQALRNLLQELGSREVSPEERVLAAELAAHLRGLLNEETPAPGVQGQCEQD